MYEFPYSTFLGIAGAFVLLSIISYCVRLKYTRRHYATHPMQVVVVEPHHQLQYPQTCWSVPIEQPPPPYNAVVNTMHTNYSTVHTNNRT